MIQAFTENHKETWALWLPLLEWAYNLSVHLSTSVMPNFLMFGFVPRMPVDFLIPEDMKGKEVARTSSEEWLAHLQMHRDSARQAVAHAQHHQAQEHNKGCRALDLKEGDKVLVIHIIQNVRS